MSKAVSKSYSIGKMLEKFYIFSIDSVIGSFQTMQEAHLHLIEMAKAESIPPVKVVCIETVAEYVFVYEDTNEKA